MFENNDTDIIAVSPRGQKSNQDAYSTMSTRELKIR